MDTAATKALCRGGRGRDRAIGQRRVLALEDSPTTTQKISTAAVAKQRRWYTAKEMMSVHSTERQHPGSLAARW